MINNFFRKKESHSSNEFSTNAVSDGGQQSLMSNEDGFINIDEVDYSNSEAGAHEKPKKTGKRILTGFIIILVGTVILTTGIIFSSGDKVIPASPTQVNPENNNKLIYLQGTPLAKDFSDPLFNVSANGLGLVRTVEMYQWSPEGDDFTKKWSEDLIKVPEEITKSKGYTNPEAMPFHSEKWVADKITIGSFIISPELSAQLAPPQPLAMTEETFQKMHPEGQKAFKLADGGYFFGIDASKPNIGDLKISFKSSPAAPVSIVAKQAGDSVVPYMGKNGAIAVIRAGDIDINTISKTIDVGGSVIIQIISYAIFGLFLIIGIFIIIGKNPLSKKESGNDSGSKSNKKPTNFQKSARNDTDTITEESEFVEEINFEDIKVDSTNFINDVTPHNLPETKYVDPIYSSPKENLENNNVPKTMAPLEKTQTSPHSLEFTPATTIETQPILPQFGETENNLLHLTPPPELLMPLTIASDPGTLPEQPEQTNYSASEFDLHSHDVMPAEVEVLSDSDLLETPQHNPNSLEFNYDSFAASNTPPAEDNTDILAQPYTESVIHHEPLQIPEGVDIISEFELENNDKTQEKTKPNNELPGIDFYSDSNNIKAEEPPAETKPEKIIKFEDLPAPPVFDEAVKASNIQPEKITQAEESVPLPPIPDFSRKSDNLTAESNSKPAIAKAPAPAKLLPPPPDFDNLLSTSKPKTPEPAPINNAMNFDLPPLPENFDPTVEMKPADSKPFADATKADNTDFDPMSDDSFSPFGDITKNPFDINDEKNNHAND